jgi:mannose-1-phosphate guanylyltransferase
LDNRRTAPASNRRWAVILAGGDGTRLQGLTRLICGDNRPKQFCPLLDGQTLLAHTMRRAERSVARPQIVFALTRTHSQYYSRELEGFEGNRIVQPSNKGTAPPILFSVLSIEQINGDALVAILPSDHHYSNETRFTAALDSAFEIAAEHPESVVLLGVQPDRLETEYGWIELGPRVASYNSELHYVHAFWEKPSQEIALSLLGRGHAAWNTFVMVGHVGAFLEMIAQAIPDVLSAVRQARLWTGSETHIEESVYNGVPPCDFSRRVLSAETARQTVLRACDLGWSDLGRPETVLAALEENRLKPWWLTDWMRRERTPAADSLSSAAA